MKKMMETVLMVAVMVTMMVLVWTALVSNNYVAAVTTLCSTAAYGMIYMICNVIMERRGF